MNLHCPIDSHSVRVSAACALALAGCMYTPSNGAQLPTFDSPITVSGLTSQPNSLVTLFAHDYCENGKTQVIHVGVPDRAVSSRTPTVFPGASSSGDLTAYQWSISYPDLTGGHNCTYWTPYGCSFPDWGPNQGTLKLSARITGPDLQSADALVFSDPETGESNLLNCVQTKQRDAMLAGQTLASADAAFACRDPDATADIQVRNVSATWAIDFSGMKVDNPQEDDFLSDGDEPYNPVIIGFRGQLAPNSGLDMRWQGDLVERSIGKGSTYTLDDRLGRVHFRNVDTLSVGEWLGCDPTTVRINVPEIIEALDISNKIKSDTATLPEIARAAALFNSFRCDVMPTFKEITVIGVAVQAIESDATPESITESAVGSMIDKKRPDYLFMLRNAGAQLQALRTAYRDVITNCNAGRDPSTGAYSGDCITAFQNVQPEEPVKVSVKVTASALAGLEGIASDIAGFIVSAGDKDDTIGAPQITMYAAINPDFMTLLTRFAGQAGVTIPRELKRLAAENLSLVHSASGVRYVTSGKTFNFTEQLQTTKLESERTRNAGRCPWTPPVESTAAGVIM